MFEDFNVSHANGLRANTPNALGGVGIHFGILCRVPKTSSGAAVKPQQCCGLGSKIIGALVQEPFYLLTLNRTTLASS